LELNNNCQGKVNGETFKKLSNTSFSLNRDKYIYQKPQILALSDFDNPTKLFYDSINCGTIGIQNLFFSNTSNGKQILDFELISNNNIERIICNQFWEISGEYYAISNDGQFVCKFDSTLEEITELITCECDEKLIPCQCKIDPDIYVTETPSSSPPLTILNGDYNDCRQCIVKDIDTNDLVLEPKNNCEQYISSIGTIIRISNTEFEVDNIKYIVNYVNIGTPSIGPNTDVTGLSLCTGNNCQPCIYFIKDVNWDNSSQTVTFEESLDGGFNYNTITLSKIINNSGETFGINDTGTILYFIDLSVPLVSEIITCECDWSNGGCGADQCVLRPGLYNQGLFNNQFAAILNSGDCTNQCVVEFPGGGSDTTQLDNLSPSPSCSQDIKWRSSDQTFTRTGIQNFTITGEPNAYVIVETLYTTFSLTNKGPFTLNATSPCTNDPITATITNIDNSKPQIDLKLVQGSTNKDISLTLIFETGNPFGEFVAINNDGTMMFVFNEVGSGNDLVNIITCECLYQ
jgi:hypothetical protein